jgi:antitoxin (DNA-binding transcriptional repressor) of toxin-antitoxin stability system
MASMIRMTVRDIRLKWPEAERLLAAGGEIVVTRDARPVARIVPFREETFPKRRRFDARAHRRWLRRFWGGRAVGPSTDEMLERDRRDE